MTSLPDDPGPDTDAGPPPDGDAAGGRELEAQRAGSRPAPPPEPDAGPADRPAGGRSGWTILTTALAVVFAAVAVLLAVVTVRLQSDLEEVRGDRAEVERVAGQFSEALLTYDHRDLDVARDRVLALSTGRFRREYEEAFEGLAALVEGFEASSTATVKAIFVGDISDGAAQAITVVDALVEGTAGPRPLLDSYIRLDLVKVDGAWRVDFVTSLTFAEDDPLPIPTDGDTPSGPPGEEPGGSGGAGDQEGGSG